MARYKQGFFKPRNPKKYKGNPGNIVYRSHWEFMFMHYCDTHPDIIEWQSEELVILYRSPIDGQCHRYFPDFKIVAKDKLGKSRTMIIEIKPKCETVPPTKPEKPTRRYINEVATYAVNVNKWDAAREYCKNRGWDFRILTEKELGIV